MVELKVDSFNTLFENLDYITFLQEKLNVISKRTCTLEGFVWNTNRYLVSKKPSELLGIIGNDILKIRTTSTHEKKIEIADYVDSYYLKTVVVKVSAWSEISLERLQEMIMIVPNTIRNHGAFGGYNYYSMVIFKKDLPLLARKHEIIESSQYPIALTEIRSDIDYAEFYEVYKHLEYIRQFTEYILEYGPNHADSFKPEY